MVSGSHSVPAEASFPRVLWVGLGCRQGASKSLVEKAIRDVFRACDLQEDAIAGLATIDTKVNEAGLIAFCRDRNLPLLFFTADQLRSVTVPNPSNAVDSVMSTPSVAEAAAILACWESVAGELAPSLPSTPHTPHRSAEHSRRSPTPILSMPKQCYHRDGQSGAVTIAVAHCG